MADKVKIKAAKDALRPLLKDIRAAESVLTECYEAASGPIGDLIKAAGHPGPHKVRVDSETVLVLTFRKTGEHMKGNKAHPTYGMKAADLGEDDE